MSQSVPLTKLLPQYNDVVETIQRRMQEDNTHHLENMLNAYTYALQGGASSPTLSYLERKLANRDNYTRYRTQKDATEWMKVDNKLHSYLGQDMKALAGGQDPPPDVPASKEPQLVQSLKLLSAFIDKLSEKMMTARHASMLEFQEVVHTLLQESAMSDRIKMALQLLVKAAVQKYREDLDRDAAELLMLEFLTTHELASGTSGCILRSGICKNLPSSGHRHVHDDHDDHHHLPMARSLPVAEEKAPPVIRLAGGGCGVPAASTYNVQSSHHQRSQSAPKFRSKAAEQLYNIISSQ